MEKKDVMLSYQTDLIEKPENFLRAAQDLVKVNRAQGFTALNDLFRAGSIPNPPPDGRYRGELIVLDIAPVLTPFFQWLANAWMPWLGKTFTASQQRGDNIFRSDSYALARLFNPLYRGFTSDGPGTYRGFAFRTYIGPGLFDPDRTVLKIDYNLKENPPLNVRRVLDELVALDDDLYLGKAHVRWWSGGWQTVAFFSLTQREA
jgi:hypothetical protein